MSKTIHRRVQTTRENFFYHLPQGIGEGSLERVGDGAKICDGNRTIDITLHDDGIDEKGSLDLPMKRVDFVFDGYDDAGIQAFFEHYDQHTMRGGG